MMSVNLPVLACRQFTRKKAFPVTVNGLLVKEPLCVRLIRVPVAEETGVSTKGGSVGVGGLGLGGIGVPQAYFELASFSPGDNMFVYAWVATGVVSLLYFSYCFLVSLGQYGSRAEIKTRFIFFCSIFL